MSGRVRVTHPDGHRTIGYRKTQTRRRQRSEEERIIEWHGRTTRRFKTDWPVRVGFRLPKDIAALVRTGPHGGRIYVLHGFVQVAHGSRAEALREAELFFRDVARGRPSFNVLAVFTSENVPGVYFRRLVVVNGAMVEASASVEPVVYGVA
jgi:hypothetical protein